MVNPAVKSVKIYNAVKSGFFIPTPNADLIVSFNKTLRSKLFRNTFVGNYKERKFSYYVIQGLLILHKVKEDDHLRWIEHQLKFLIPDFWGRLIL